MQVTQHKHPRVADARGAVARVLAFGLTGIFAFGPVSTLRAGGLEELKLRGPEMAGRGVFEGTVLDTNGRIHLKPAKPRAAGEVANISFGTYTCNIELPAGSAVSMVTVLGLDAPLADKTPPTADAAKDVPPAFPYAATDVVTQIRFLQSDGTWSPWSPRNLLAGGEFPDANHNGIPDWTWVFQIRSAGNRIFADWPVADPLPLLADWRKVNRLDLPSRGDFVDAREAPPGGARSLRLERHTDDGQDTAEMRRDFVPPGNALTVSGWDRYDIAGRSMGVMARFHEFASNGQRVNKFVLLGDDDFHQPAGSSPWRWRALSFTAMPTTLRLGIYPIRMIRAQGRAWAANWEIREGWVYSETGGRMVFQEDFSRPDHWELSQPNLTQVVSPPDGTSKTMVIRPSPLTVATATQRDFIPVEPGKLYAFRIAMQNDASPSYDLTHDTWMSCYLEFFDARKQFIDYVKAMVFRPVLERPVAAAMVAPAGSRWARFRLVASHITYDDRSRITGVMAASFRDLRLEESPYDPVWTPGVEQSDVRLSPPIRAERMQIRSRLFTRDPRTSPSFGGYAVKYSK